MRLKGKTRAGRVGKRKWPTEGELMSMVSNLQKKPGKSKKTREDRIVMLV